AGAVPVIAVEIDGDAAVRGLTAQIAADVAERYAAVGGLELGGAAVVLDGDADVPAGERQHHRARDADVEADRPGFVLARRRTLGVHAAARGVDADTGHHAPCIRLGSRL